MPLKKIMKKKNQSTTNLLNQRRIKPNNPHAVLEITPAYIDFKNPSTANLPCQELGTPAGRGMSGACAGGKWAEQASSSEGPIVKKKVLDDPSDATSQASTRASSENKLGASFAYTGIAFILQLACWRRD